ncbi:MAG: hypothetical protein JWN14_2661 [Chthonomonadales bacterium]|nr:hypothetical protein [Chthonomonadales bacterium]
MKKFIVFAGMLGLCLAPIAATAQCGCDTLGGGGTVIAEAVIAHASFSSASASSPVTITAGVHSVELIGAKGETYGVTYSRYFIIDGDIDLSTKVASPTPTKVITTDATTGKWSLAFSLTSGAKTLSPGSHTAVVWSDIFDTNSPSIHDTEPKTGVPPVSFTTS